MPDDLWIWDLNGQLNPSFPVPWSLTMYRGAAPGWEYMAEAHYKGEERLQ